MRMNSSCHSSSNSTVLLWRLKFTFALAKWQMPLRTSFINQEADDEWRVIFFRHRQWRLQAEDALQDD